MNTLGGTEIRGALASLGVLALVACGTRQPGARDSARDSAHVGAKVGATAVAPARDRAAAPTTGDVEPDVANALDIGKYLTAGGFAALPKLRCTQDSSAETGDVSRTVRGPLPDSSAFVLLVRRAPRDTVLHHVELVRRLPDHAQIGVNWDALTDTVRVEHFPLREGTPTRTETSWGGGMIIVLRGLAGRAMHLGCSR